MSQTILVVDDSSAIRQSMKYVLETAGYGVIDASNGKEALNVIS